jgi:hypothetical protein
MELGSYFLFLQEQIKDIISLLTLSVSLDTYKKLTHGFLLLSNYLLLSLDPFLLLPFIPPPPSRHDWDVECYLHFAAFIVGLARP